MAEKLQKAEKDRHIMEEKVKLWKTPVGLARPIQPHIDPLVTHRGLGAFCDKDFMRKPSDKSGEDMDESGSDLSPKCDNTSKITVENNEDEKAERKIRNEFDEKDLKSDKPEDTKEPEEDSETFTNEKGDSNNIDNDSKEIEPEPADEVVKTIADVVDASEVIGEGTVSDAENKTSDKVTDENEIVETISENNSCTEQSDVNITGNGSVVLNEA